MVTLIVTVLGILSALSVAAGAFYSARARDYQRAIVLPTPKPYEPTPKPCKRQLEEGVRALDASQLVEGVRMQTVYQRQKAQVSGWSPAAPAVTSPDAGIVAEELEAFAAHLESDDRETPFRFYVTPLVVHSDVSSLVGYRADGTLDWEDGAQRARELAWAWRQTKPTPTDTANEGSHPSIRGHNATGFTVIDYRRGTIQSAADEWRRLNPEKW